MKKAMTGMVCFALIPGVALTVGDFVKAGEVAETQIEAGLDILTGSSQQAPGELRTVADHRNAPAWRIGQMHITEGYKCIVTLIAKLDAGVRASNAFLLIF